MNEGGLLKMYVEREHVSKNDLAAALGVAEDRLQSIFQSQTIEPDIKEKLKSFLNRNIFDGTLLTDYYTNVPDEQANKQKG